MVPAHGEQLVAIGERSSASALTLLSMVRPNLKKPKADIVGAVSKRLDEIGNSLRPEASVAQAMVAPWSLLQRSRSLVAAITWLVDGPSEAATWIVTRSLADLAINIAWLRVDPATHVKLWSAEAYRRELELLPILEEQLRSGHRKPP